MGRSKYSKDAIKQGQSPLKLHLNVEQLPQWQEEPELKCRKGYHTAQRDVGRYGVLNYLKTSHRVDNGRGQGAERAHQHEEPLSDHVLSHFQVGQFLIFRLETLAHVGLASIRLDQEDATDRERLLHQGSERGQAL